MTAAGGVHLLNRADNGPHKVSGPPGRDAYPTPESTGVRALADARVRLRPGPVRVATEGFVSWALLDRRTGRVTGSANLSAAGDALAMVRPWLAADHLRRVAAGGHVPTQRRLRQLRAVVHGHGTSAADALYRELGARASVQRMVRTCGLTDTRPDGDSWKATVVSARDAVRIGACLADGRAAGARWTPWLLNAMRIVHGSGNFGARRVLPTPLAGALAVANGWLLQERARLWHLSCLAVDRDWVLSVLTRYPKRLGLRHGKSLCDAIGSQVIVIP